MKIPVGLSNHHIHITDKVKEILFGKDYELTFKRKLRQGGQFACEEVLNVMINNHTLENVRIIGPCRNYNQVELLDRDCDICEVKHVRSDSEKHEGTLPFKLIGPKGTYEQDKGAFVAHNHIHLDTKTINNLGYNEETKISVTTSSGIVVNNISVKTHSTYVNELHMNKDEAEVLGLTNEDEIINISMENKDA